jgi:hypothetical protein
MTCFARLLDDLGHPETTRLGHFGRRGQTRHDDDRETRIGRPDGSEHGDATHGRQPDVEHDGVRARTPQIGKASFPRVLHRRLVAVCGERLRENLSDVHVVFDQEKPHLPLPPPAARSYHRRADAPRREFFKRDSEWGEWHTRRSPDQNSAKYFRNVSSF